MAELIEVYLLYEPSFVVAACTVSVVHWKRRCCMRVTSQVIALMCESEFFFFCYRHQIRDRPQLLILCPTMHSRIFGYL